VDADHPSPASPPAATRKGIAEIKIPTKSIMVE
jgi:hypothetical protein